jgi:uncharacterized protein YndB with AHSA1/START domain
MARPRTVSHTVVVAATAESLYEMVSDPTRMGGWSPENTGATLAGPDTGRAAVGTVFDGHNRRGRMRWTTRCVVTAADPGERFAFSVRAWGLRTPLLRAPIASWEYRFEAVPGGTRVTETWTDDRAWPDAVANAFDRVATGGSTFAVFNLRNIQITLQRLSRAAEAASTPS